MEYSKTTKCGSSAAAAASLISCLLLLVVGILLILPSAEASRAARTSTVQPASKARPAFLGICGWTSEFYKGPCSTSDCARVCREQEDGLYGLCIADRCLCIKLC